MHDTVARWPCHLFVESRQPQLLGRTQWVDVQWYEMYKCHAAHHEEKNLHCFKLSIRYEWSILGGVKQEKDLGVWIDSHLTWNKQVVEQSSKANKLLGFIKRACKEISNPRTRRCLFLAIARPHLGYATQIWAPQTIDLIKRVERVQLSENFRKA